MSDNIISPEQLAAEVGRVLLQYRDATMDALKKATDSVTKEAVAELKQSSPKDTGDYAKAWTASKNPWLRGSAEYGKIVHVKAPHYLTHLLEYGHDLVRDGRRVGRAPAQPHIKPAEQEAVRDFETELVNDIKGVQL